MSEEITKTFTGHNFKADYRYKVSQKQKANGEIQLGEVGVRSDELETLFQISFDIVEKWYKAGKQKGIMVVSPYEKGREPV